MVKYWISVIIQTIIEFLICTAILLILRIIIILIQRVFQAIEQYYKKN